jgi:hypothetical protein
VGVPIQTRGQTLWYSRYLPIYALCVHRHKVHIFTATLLVMVNVMKGVGVHPPPSPAQANFTLMTECTPESSRYYSVYSVVTGMGEGHYKQTICIYV